MPILKTEIYKSITCLLILFFAGISLGCIYIRMDGSNIFVFIGKQDQGYFIDRNGNKSLDTTIYENGRAYSNGYAVVENLGDVSIINFKGENIWKFGREHHISPEYGEINENVFCYYVLPNELAFYAGNKHSPEELEYFKYGYVYLIDLNTKKEVKLKQYISVDEMHDGLLRVASKKHRSEDFKNWYKDAKYGFINKNGELKIEAIYDNAQNFSDGLAAVKRNNKWCYIDTVGRTVLEGNYDFAYSFEKGIAIVELNNKYGLIDKKGNWIVAPTYGVIMNAGENRYKVCKDKANQKFALLTKDGKLITDYSFDEVICIGENRTVIKLNEKFFLATEIGSSIKELKIDEILYSRQGRATVKVNDKLGIIDTEGNWVIPAEYEVISKY